MLHKQVLSTGPLNVHVNNKHKADAGPGLCPQACSHRSTLLLSAGGVLNKITRFKNFCGGDTLKFLQ